MTKLKPKERPHYVNNPEFYAAMVVYCKQMKEAEEAGEERPRVPNYIGDCISKIAHKLSNSPKFVGYPFKEDMIYDAIENCLRYIHNFNPEKSQNPFAYFTQISAFAFIRRIKKEKKYLQTKLKLIENTNIENSAGCLQTHDDGNYDMTIKRSKDSEENANIYMSSYEEAEEKRRKKRNRPVDEVLKDD